MSPELIVTLLLFMAADAGRRGYRHVLEEFWDQAARSGIRMPQAKPVSAAAFCLARRKLAPELFGVLLEQVHAEFRARHGAKLLWHGRRVFAVDGSKFNLQRSADLAQAFGIPSGGHCPQVLVSTLFDVIGKVPCALTVAPSASCERQQMLKLAQRLQAGDLLVLDRGYPSFEVLEALSRAEIDVLVRVPARSSFDAIQVFQDSGGADYRVLVQPPRDGTHPGAQPLELRALRIDTSGKEDWFLLTSLRRAHVTSSQIAQLYHLRWEIEEFFKLLKGDYFSQRQFHAKTALAVEQEIRAQMLFVALSRLLMATAADYTKTPYQDLSSKSGILGLGSHLVGLMLRDDPDVAASELGRLLPRLVRNRNQRRPGRVCPRRSFKPGPRWNSRGRIGA